MAIRALIFGVENYAKSEGLSKKLEGTLENARGFEQWVLQKKGAQRSDVWFFPDPTKDEIASAFRDLVDQGKRNTEELYVFFSGHGFTFDDQPLRRKAADVVVGSEFKNLSDSGGACLRLDEIQTALYNNLGFGTHFYFIDACRNTVSSGKVSPGTLGWVRDVIENGDTNIFTLFSTERGSTAATESGFATVLVEGLAGRSRAKVRDGLKMVVTFHSLRDYLEKKLQQPVQVDPGNGPGRILEIKPIPTYRCEVHVDGADSKDVFTLEVNNALSQRIVGPKTFQGLRTDFTQGPDDYYVQVSHPEFIVSPTVPLFADLYEDCVVKFTRGDAEGPVRAGAQPPPANPPDVTLSGPSNSRIVIRNIATGDVSEDVGKFSGPLAAGTYEVSLREPGWTSVRKRTLEVKPGEQISLNVGARRSTPVRDGIVAAIPGQHDNSSVDFSESLGPMANEDLGLWVSLMGASRIVREWGDFSKLRGLPLEKFEDVKPGDSPSYLLLAMETLPKRVEVAVHDFGKGPEWRSLSMIDSLPGVFQFRSNTGAGPHLVSIRTPGNASFTTVIYCLANRATLFAVAGETNGETRIHQYMLPLARLVENLSQLERDRQSNNPLEAVRFIALAQKQMSLRRPLVGSLVAAAPNVWFDLLHGKWFDPVMGLMAAYALARTREFSMVPHGMGTEVLGNLRKSFPELPDVEIVAKLAKAPYVVPTRSPLFLEGVVGLGEEEVRLPLPRGRMDFRGPWVTWISAV
jgi:hypothetical protein